MRFTDLMLAEYGHLAESFLRNEEAGEKRVSFFVTLTSGAVALLGFVRGKEVALQPSQADAPTIFALTALLLFGHFTFVRILRRNLETDKYLRGLARLRQYFVREEDRGRRARFCFDPYGPPKTRGWKPSPREPANARRLARYIPDFLKRSYYHLHQGGWLETVALVNALLLGALLAMFVPFRSWWIKGAFGLAAAVLAWIVQLDDANRRYTEAQAKAAADEAQALAGV